MSESVSEVAAQGVFLSYSSRDRPTAIQLKSSLERLGVAVRIDIEALEPGTAIRDFILASIRSTSATVLVVSEASLTSDWVALEVGTSLADSELWSKREFIACYLDDGFLDPAFRLRATERIDTSLSSINQLIQEYDQKNLDSDDLNAKKSRLHRLRVGLGPLLDRLTNSSCVDLRGSLFENAVQSLARRLRTLAPGKSQAPLVQATDIESRRDEIFDLVANGDGERALKRVMDFVRDFAECKRTLREIVVVTGNYRMLGAEEDRPLREVREERTQLLSRALEMVDGVVESLTQRVA